MAFLVWQMNDKPLGQFNGGPFSIIFPVEQHPELKGLVPESGALLFLKKIIIEQTC